MSEGKSNHFDRPVVSVVIVNWNTAAMLMRCLKAVFDTVRNLRFEVIVVDNASSDDSVRACRLNFPSVKIIANAENVGFAKANNQAIVASEGQYILLLNSDAFVHSGSVEKVVHFMDAHDKVGAAGCKLVYENGDLQRSCTAFPTVFTELWQGLYLDRIFSRSKLFGQYWMTYWDMCDSRPVDCVMGAFIMLRRVALDEIGVLDEGFFFYSEEVDLCYRLWRSGWLVYYVADGSATHIWGGSERQSLSKRLVQLYTSRLYFFRKHYSKAHVALFKATVFFASLMRGVGGAVVSRVRPTQKRDELSKGYWHLMRQLPSL